MPPVDDDPLRSLAFAARDGDTDALERIVAAIQDDIYRLAVRMLWHPEDARDATQEALLRIVTRIASYRGDAVFRTWAYRVAANHILNWRKGRVEQENLSFRRFADQLHDGLADPALESPDAALLAEEVKLGCTLGMLLCLDRDQRLAYVLSDVFELPSEAGAYVCGISASAYRKRASRARAQLRVFVAEHCGLVNRHTACRCDRRVATAISIGRVDPAAPLFATPEHVAAAAGEMGRLHDLASLMRSHPAYQAPGDVANRISEIIIHGGYDILE